MRLHRFRRIHVDVLHEPTRLVRPDGQEGEIDRAQPRGDLPEMRAVTGVAGEQDPAPFSGIDQESAPECTVTVEHVARREVLRRRQRDREGRSVRRLPPVDLLDPPDACGLEQPAVAERRDQRQVKTAIERAQGCEVAMIVMIVTQKHAGNCGQILEANARRPRPTRARERHRARPPRVYGIGQQVHATHLNQKRGVTDERQDRPSAAAAAQPARRSASGCAARAASAAPSMSAGRSRRSD